MRLLFYVEPFPVRGRPLDFLWIHDRWRQLAAELRQGGDEASFLVSEALAQARPGASPRPLTPADFGPAPAGPNGADAAEVDAGWVRLMSEPDHAPWRPLVERVLDAVAPDAVLSWTVNAPLAAAAAARRIPLLHCEQGPMRPPHPMLWYCDPVGVNGASAVPRVWEALRHEPLRADEERALDVFLEEAIPRPSLRREDVLPRLGLDPGRRTIAVFLQVPRDSNVLAWSRVAGGAALLRMVAAAARPLGIQVVARPHPLAPEPLDEAALDGVRLCPDVPATGLAEVADAVVTINSSVAFEALARGRIVYGFGGAPWSGTGVCREPEPGPESLGRALAAETWSRDEREEALRRRFLHFMLFRYLVPDSEMWDAPALRARAARWRHLLAAGAPLARWFEQEAGRLRELRADVRGRAERAEAERERAGLTRTADELRQGLEDARRSLDEERARSAQAAGAVARLEEELEAARRPHAARARPIEAEPPRVSLVGRIMQRVPWRPA